MDRRPTISSDYLALQRELHRNPNYGVTSLELTPLVAELIRQTGARSLCDYGAGKCNLLIGLKRVGAGGIDYYPFDPAFPEYGEPRAADLVCCIDVLEHIEPDYLGAALTELSGLTQECAFLSIATGPAGKKLADGRNAHLIQQPSSWWLPRLCEHFEIRQLRSYRRGHFWLIASRRHDDRWIGVD